MRSVLLADIGGTNSRLALLGANGEPERMRVIENDSVLDLESAIVTYCAAVAVHPAAAVLAVAGPIDHADEVALTNRNWRFRRGELAQRFGFSALRVINDFEAIAWALRRLRSEDVHPLGGPPAPLDAARRNGIKLALGPGTGLGVAALVPFGEGFHVISSEGGHASFGPQAADEFDVFARLMREHGYVSAETILSGPGLARLWHALDPATASRTPEAIVTGALAGEPAAQAAVRLFVRLLGRVAGDLGLTFKAVGGVYIAGGVASRFGPLFDAEEFRAAFEKHPPYEKMLHDIPTWLMGRTEPGLIGCAVVAEDMIGAP